MSDAGAWEPRNLVIGPAIVNRARRFHPGAKKPGCILRGMTKPPKKKTGTALPGWMPETMRAAGADGTGTRKSTRSGPDAPEPTAKKAQSGAGD